MSHFLRLPTFLGLALMAGLLALLASIPAITLAGHVGPIGSLHIEIATHTTPPSEEAFDFDSTSYASIADPSADIRLGTDPISGYQQLLGLNGGVLANLGLVDFEVVGCEDAESATFSTEVDTPVQGNVPTLNTVFLVNTGAGMLAKLNLTLIDFTAPNGLAFDYETLDCSVEPTITLDPPTDTNTVGEDHTVTATVKEGGDPLDAGVEFEVTAGPNAGDSGTDDTDGNGEATFTYTGDGAGTDTIEACVVDFPDVCTTATKIWEEPTPTPTPTPSPTPTAVAEVVQLPTTGGTPSDGDSGALPWLAAIAGAFALVSGGGLWLAYQRRRIR